MSERSKLYEEKMEKTLRNLDGELQSIRAGRANPHVLDKITVDYYGSPTAINQVANVQVPEARMITISPWEGKMVKTIVKAIQSSDLGINPSDDGHVIRLVFPELTEERRKQLAKDVKKKGEKSFIPADRDNLAAIYWGRPFDMVALCVKVFEVNFMDFSTSCSVPTGVLEIVEAIKQTVQGLSESSSDSESSSIE